MESSGNSAENKLVSGSDSWPWNQRPLWNTSPSCPLESLLSLLECWWGFIAHFPKLYLLGLCLESSLSEADWEPPVFVGVNWQQRCCWGSIPWFKNIPQTHDRTSKTRAFPSLTLCICPLASSLYKNSENKESHKIPAWIKGCWWTWHKTRQSITAAVFICNFKRVCLHVSVGALRGQKGAPDHLKLEPTEVGDRDQTCVSGKAGHTLNHETISTPTLAFQCCLFPKRHH